MPDTGSREPKRLALMSSNSGHSTRGGTHKLRAHHNKQSARDNLENTHRRIKTDCRRARVHILHMLAIRFSDYYIFRENEKGSHAQCCGTVTIYYGSGSGSDF